MKFELDRLTFDEFCEDYEIQSPLSLFSEKDNGGFIFSLFGKEYSDKLLEISYQTIKDDVGELYHLYNQTKILIYGLTSLRKLVQSSYSTTNISW